MEQLPTRHSTALPRLALTAGEPAGIGAELIARVAATDVAADLIAIGDADLLANGAKAAGVSLRLTPYDPSITVDRRAAGELRVIPIALAARVQPGTLDARNAAHVLATLARAADGALGGEFDAIVTAPVHKGVINDAGIRFTGHTEFFAERAHCPVVMMLVADTLRVALATTHLALADVPRAITHAAIVSSVRILHRDLVTRFAVANPRIAVLGLNPHAGEGGHLGREEIDTIVPALAELRAEGMQLIGPLPADTAFLPSHLAGYDAVLAMYHDQGLPVLKHHGFGNAVNITLGLPYARTSVDHGTALDLAGKGVADVGSLMAATKLAIELIERSRARKHA